MSLPIEFVEKYKNLLGEEESSRFFTAIDSPSKKGFRLNPLKNNYQDIQYSLKEPIEFTYITAIEKFYGTLVICHVSYILSITISQIEI